MHQTSTTPSSDDVDHELHRLALLEHAGEHCPVPSNPCIDTVRGQEEEAAARATLPSIKMEPQPPCTDLTNHEISTLDFRPQGSDSPLSSESVAIKSEPNSADVSSRPNYGIADLTGSTRAPLSKMQELKPLDVPRNKLKALPFLQPTCQVENPIRKRDLPPRSQLKQLSKPGAPLTNATEFLTKVKLVTADEYDDAELHGDFKHMLHILIPSNATTALLEQRGQPIQSISQQTGCTLSIREPGASPFKDDRVLRIHGKAKCISLAQRLVIAYIRAFRAEKNDPIYMDLSDEASPVALPATSITKALSGLVTAGKKSEVEITNPFHWLVQRDQAGKMMGRQGCVLASIRRDTGALIHIDDDVIPGTTERRVTLSGSVEAIAAAVKKIKSRSNGRPEVAGSVVNDGHGQYFAIPYHAAGCLIGPRGSIIKNINERTGARLQIPSAEDLPLGGMNRILHVQGTPKQAEHARRVVTAKLHDFLTSSKSPKSLSLYSTGLKGDRVTIKVLLPLRVCGFMLDHRGRLIREISKKSGAHTHFLAAHDDDNRVCVFTGDMSCVLRAQRLVLQVIAGDAISSKRAAPARKRKRSHRDEEKDEEYDEVAVEEVKDEEERFYEDEVNEENYCGDEYEDALRHPVRRRDTCQHPNRCLRHGESVKDMYIHDDNTEYEERPCQPICRQPVAIRPRKYFDDESAVDDCGLDDCDPDKRLSYDVPRSRPPMRPTGVRRQPVIRHQDENDDHYEKDDDEYDYADDSDGVYEDSIVGTDLAKRRLIGSLADEQRRPIACLGRKVQMVVPKPHPREGRSTMRLSDRRCTNDTGSTRPSNRNGTANVRQSVSQSGRGNGHPTTKRGRNGGKKRQTLTVTTGC